MKLRKFAYGTLLGIVGLFGMAGTASADPSFDEGTVSVVASIRTETGHFDEYMAWLQSTWKKGMEAQRRPASSSRTTCTWPGRARRTIRTCIWS